MLIYVQLSGQGIFACARSERDMVDADAGTQTTNRNLITFRLGQQTYALPIEPIEQIVEMVTVTPLPQANPLVRGVINVRGKAMPLINLRRYFGLPEADPSLDAHIILAQIGAWRIGLVVDQVLNVVSLPVNRIVRPSEIMPEGLSGVSFLCGLVQSQDGLVLVLDPDLLFRPDQLRDLAALPVAAQKTSTARHRRSGPKPKPGGVSSGVGVAAPEVVA